MEKEQLLKEAFDAALVEDSVKQIDKDNADAQIQDVMARYIAEQDEEIRLQQIGEYINEQTRLQDTLLQESYQQATGHLPEEAPLEQDSRQQIQNEMRSYFEDQKTSIRLKRIELYVQEQTRKLEAKKNRKKEI